MPDETTKGKNEELANNSPPAETAPIKAHICVAIAVLNIDNLLTDDIYARSVAEELLVCRFCIIFLCFKELMVEINIIGFHLIQFTGGNQGFYKQGVELVCRIEIIGLALIGSI